jgi:cytidylate kinase
MNQSKLVVISAEEGSGGREIAQELASILDFAYFDSYILQDLENVAKIENNFTHQPFWGVGTSNLFQVPACSEHISNGLDKIIKEHYNLIIYDSRAIYRLGSMPNLLKIRVVAPLPVRIERLALLLGIDQSNAARLVTEADQSEKCFMRREFDLDWDNPANFQLTLNTGDLTLNEATLYLAVFVRAYQFKASAGLCPNRSYDRFYAKEKYNLTEASNLLHLPCELLRQAIYNGSLPVEVREHSGHEVFINKPDLLNWQTKAGNRTIKREGGKGDVS